jgi:2-polyprenyl-3-methyl-5-hydroxy-6-metoxy-1,4-benzoquinol methylase
MTHIKDFISENPNLKNYNLFNWDEDSIRNYWDFEATRGDDKYFTYEVRDELFFLLKEYFKSDLKTLDFGAGKGFFTNKLLNENIKTAAYDISIESKRYLEKKFAGHKHFLGAFTKENKDKLNEQFDIVLMFEVIEHLEDNVRSNVYETISKFLKPNGKFIISTPNNENLMNSVLCNPVTNELYHRWQHVYSWTAQSLIDSAKPFGFKAIKTMEIDLKYQKPGIIPAIKRLYKKNGSNLFVIFEKE